ncbi:MAG: oligosaccharide flippase family protein, partial [Gammaproteobacteria bacterium]|nr:oligosaccharide flippase family protein [Gammaproteobacteria bacterium]
MALRRLLDVLRADLSPHSERGRMVRSAGLVAAFKIAATLIAFGASLIYARALGPHGYGLYAYVIAWAMLLAVPVAMGIPGYFVREGAKMSASVRWMRHWADQRVLVAGLAVGVLMACAYFIPQAADARWLFVVAALLPLLQALGGVRNALLRSRGWVARSQWPNLVAGPALMLAVLAIIWAVRGSLYPIELVAAMMGAAFFQLLANELQLRRAARGPKTAPEPPIRLRAALPFMWLGGLYLLNSRVDLIMLGTLNGAHDAGIYAIATRAAALVPFVAAAANMALAPRIARLYHAGDHALLQRMVTAAARRVFVATLPLALLLIIAAWWLLYYLFGEDFTPAARPMQILAGAQLVVVAFGSVGTILNMAGQE